MKLPESSCVILVDKEDKEVGTEEKIKAHRQGKLHRAFSVFVFNSDNKLLLQKRAENKYHSAGLWSNTCCSHPLPGESVEAAAHRRLKEEMGFVCRLKEIFSFIYKFRFKNGLSEFEYDHVLIGFFDGRPLPDPKEVDAWKWIGLPELKKDIQNNPRNYTHWLKTALNKLIDNNFFGAERK